MDSKKWFIDLFAGGGGLSEGFANAGLSPIAHVEKNNDACETLRTRACYRYLKETENLNYYYDYLQKKIERSDFLSNVPEKIIEGIIQSEMRDNTMDDIFDSIDKRLEDKGVTKVEAIVGGPPCQAYSYVGRARKCMENDPRNTLYKLYCQVIERYLPEFLVFENVLGLTTAGNGQYLTSLKDILNNIGYEIEYKILNAADYGVLQNRRRIILCGWKKGSDIRYPEPEKIKHNFKVDDILNDLPSIKPGENSKEYTQKTINNYLKKFKIRNEKDVLTWHVSRPNNERDIAIYRNVIKAWDEHSYRLKYSELPVSLRTHKNTKNFLDRYKIIASNLPASHTITAHISKDGHYYIHPDIKQLRSITVREAARIQSFPDDYYFEGARTSVFTQIGNAVPPLMAYAIAKAFLSQ